MVTTLVVVDCFTIIVRSQEHLTNMEKFIEQVYPSTPQDIIAVWVTLLPVVPTKCQHGSQQQ